MKPYARFCVYLAKYLSKEKYFQKKVQKQTGHIFHVHCTFSIGFIALDKFMQNRCYIFELPFSINHSPEIRKEKKEIRKSIDFRLH
jgi:hypothetical protein